MSVTVSQGRQDGGLTEQEAVLKLASEGRNEIDAKNGASFFRTVADVIKEPMLLLLVAIAVLYGFLGEPSESSTMAVAVLVVLILSVVQERRTERALTALRGLRTPTARVIRDGVARSVQQGEIVSGDLVLLSEGERIPADAVVVDSVGLSVDESALTGESVPVTKRAGNGELEMAVPGGDATPFVYSGTLVVAGHGLAEVRCTGRHTAVGRIGQSLQGLEVATSPLYQESRRIVFVLGTLGAGLCLLATAIFGFRDHLWDQGILAGLTMAISIVPEEIPVVFTILMALGAWRIAKSNVLTRRLPAIETVGAVTALCVDKTGTLTQNRMQVAVIATGGCTFECAANLAEASEEVQKVVRFSVLASQPLAKDPMEKALWALSEALPVPPHTVEGTERKVAEYPLTLDLLATSFLWSRPDGTTIVATKGAPEAICKLCGLSDALESAVLQEMRALADRGLRVLGVAGGEWRGGSVPTDHRALTPQFLGLVGLEDPIREEVPPAIAQCSSAGIRVLIVTGDHPSTAKSVARKIGLDGGAEVISGAELASMTDSELRTRVRTCNVYARMLPEQKLRLVRALQDNDEVVAMTGDGVNDAPALHAANVGIAMGGRGTDVAREAADLILLDDNFGSIVKAIRLGRRTFDNLRHAITYIIAIHIPIGGLTILPVLLGMPLILLPIHIVLLEMTIDPACAMVFEAEPEDCQVMQRPPRGVNATLAPRLALTLAQGFGVLAATFVTFLFARLDSGSTEFARAMTFGVLIVANLSLIGVSTGGRRHIWEVFMRPSRAFVLVAIGILVGLAAFLFVPVLRERAHFAALSLSQVLLMLLVGASSALWVEVVGPIHAIVDSRRTRVSRR